MQTATLELGSYTCNCLWVASVTKRDCIEQVEADMASAREALADVEGWDRQDAQGAKISRRQGFKERGA